MRLTNKTEYGLVCLLYMARNPGSHPVAIKDIVKSERFSLTFTEKILQKLKTAGIVFSQQGNRGGYLLAKSPAEITLKEIVEALEGQTFSVFCQPKKGKEVICNHHLICDVSPVWYKTKELLDRFYHSITLEMLAKRDMRFQSFSFSAGD